MSGHWKKLHEKLGCQGCQYCDTDSLWRGPCCEYEGYLDVDEETKKCKTRKEAERK